MLGLRIESSVLSLSLEIVVVKFCSLLSNLYVSLPFVWESWSNRFIEGSTFFFSSIVWIWSVTQLECLLWAFLASPLSMDLNIFSIYLCSIALRRSSLLWLARILLVNDWIYYYSLNVFTSLLLEGERRELLRILLKLFWGSLPISFKFLLR